ncbi:MAG: hypothetical protein ABGX22_06870 [Pirellulaceae bacterium]|nr:hypothetical protein [Planctomycetaceae bacterium]
MRRYTTFFCLIGGLMATLSTHIEAGEASKWKAEKFLGFKLEDVAIAKVTGKTVEEKKISILLNGFEWSSSMERRKSRYTKLPCQCVHVGTTSRIS